MKSENRYEGFDDVVVGIVRGKARDLARRPEFSDQELEDLEQEIMTAVAIGLTRYDENLSSISTYVRRIVNRKAERLIEHRLAGKRAAGFNAPSIEAMLALDEDALPDDPHKDPAFSVARKLDVETVIDRLPEREQEICQHLRTHSVAEVATLTGTPRATIYGSLSQIRNIFAENKLKEYLA